MSRPSTNIFEFGGIQYKIHSDEGLERDEQVLLDFNYCIEKKDWTTIRNRITNGLMWGWLTEIKK
tara:strand:+ start:587 stop:781 length:195 start_codon:yes stop_codon:yes gene_type:complete